MRRSIDRRAVSSSTGIAGNKCSLCGLKRSTSSSWFIGGRRKFVLVQDFLFSSDYILQQVFRKDGPPLGVEFDQPTSRQFCVCEAARDGGSVSAGGGKGINRRKKGKRALSGKKTSHWTEVVGKKHGMGKGLMTLWQTSDRDSRRFPSNVDFTNTKTSVAPTHLPKLRGLQKCRVGLQKQQSKKRLSGRKLNETKKLQAKKKKVKCNKNENSLDVQRGKCKLVTVLAEIEKQSDVFSDLIDDEELELRELQAGPNRVKCSAHISSTGLHFCSLCKGFLSKFPPESVKMKDPFGEHPWKSFSQLAKKFFKVFRFLYSHAEEINICPFAFEEFSQAFHDKDSQLLGKIHIALLRFLFHVTEMELSNKCILHTNKSFLFLEFIHSVQLQEVGLWNRFLNSLTWVEISRQVLVAAGFGSKSLPIAGLKKETDILIKYGLDPGTLKYVLFTALSNAGNNGLKISDLANFIQVSGLNLEKTTEEVAYLISSTLASDITLFERISCATYRLRNNIRCIEELFLESDPAASEGVEAYYGYNKHESRSFTTNEDASQYKDANGHGSAEIDESHREEVWLVGLREGEYSDLNIEEKLDILLALVSFLNLEEPVAGHVLNSSHGPGDVAHSMQCVFLGSDRRYNRYWLFLGTCTTKDPGHSRIYVESSEDGQWTVIDTREAVYTLIRSLDSRGKREAQLVDILQRVVVFLYQSSPEKSLTDSGSRQVHSVVTEDSSSPVSVVGNNSLTITFDDVAIPCVSEDRENREEWARLQDFDEWIWSDFYSNMSTVKNWKRSYDDSFARCRSCHDLYWRDEKHCIKCHLTFELDFDLEEKYAIHAAICKKRESFNVRRHNVLSSKLQLLKAAVYTIEIVMIQNSLTASMTKSRHNLWVKRLRRSTSIDDLLQVITDFTNAINVDWSQKGELSSSPCNLQELISLFPTLPHTSSAVSFWLVRLDALVEV